MLNTTEKIVVLMNKLEEARNWSLSFNNATNCKEIMDGLYAAALQQEIQKLQAALTVKK